jgi:hypothetical protein
VYYIVIEFEVPGKLVSLIKVHLYVICSDVCVG